MHAVGHSAEAQMVNRSGKRPRLVLRKRRMACDDDCPQYMQISEIMLSHCLVLLLLTRYNKQLDKFIASYETVKNVKKTPNLTTKLPTCDVS